MRRIHSTIILWPAVLLLLFPNLPSQNRDRSQVPIQYQWDLSDLFPSDQAWQNAKQNLLKQLKQMASFRGSLAESASRLLHCLQTQDRIGIQFQRLSSYSWNKSREDTRQSSYRAMDQETRMVSTAFQSETSFIEPEILAMDGSLILEFLKAEPGLAPYKFYLQDLLRRKQHTLSAEEEKIIAEAGPMIGSPAVIYKNLMNVDWTDGDVTLKNGETVRLNRKSFERYKKSPDRSDRERIYETFYGKFRALRGTLGALMGAKVSGDLFNTRARGYDDCLQMVLFPDNIPVEVYHRLIADANKHLDKFHRYLKIRKRILGVDTLKYTDLALPLFSGNAPTIGIEEAKKLIIDSLSPLGPAYIVGIKRAFASRWIDVYPTPGKRSGSYCDPGAYGEHPYVMVNYRGDSESVSVLAHELGHAMHRYHTDQSQPFSTSSYSSFVAEVASTVNQVLLKKHMLERIGNGGSRLRFLLSNMDEKSIFNRVLVSEFELAIRREAEKGKSLTGDRICRIYLDLVRKYYGHEQGVCRVPDYIDMKWALSRLLFIKTYRIYPYVTSRTAAAILADRILGGDKPALKNYLEFLSAGGSDYPVDLLKKAGVDMTSSGPFEAAMRSMVGAMDEIEKILDE